MEPTMSLGAVVAFAVGVLALLRRRTARARWLRLTAAQGRPRRARRVLGARRPATRLRSRPVRLALGASAAGLAGAALGGPVAGFLLAVYGTVGVLVVAWRRRQRTEAMGRRSALDAVAGLAAELRAGQSVADALAAAESALSPPHAAGAVAGRIAARVACAVAVADTSGAPLADVLDRLDGHLRTADRARAVAEAQAAGARASALMLAMMPVAGVGLGYAIGTDPFDVLLHTPLGAACLTGAVVLQLGGLGWSVRLSRLEVST